MSTNTDDLRITGTRELRAPEELLQLLPVSEVAAKTVTRCHSDVRDILTGRDDRLVVVVGPCSIKKPPNRVDLAR